MKKLLIFFFHHLYHSMAWTYDLVAWLVSLGRWNQWGRTVLALLPPGPILEFGFGPGHLQKTLSGQGLPAFGLDESWQMARIAVRRNPKRNLVRAFAEDAPFAASSFQSLVAVFPAPYIFKFQIAQEVARLLAPGGKLVILLAARPLGDRLPDLFVRNLFRITGETPSKTADFSALLSVFRQAGLMVTIEWREQDRSELLFLTGVKVNPQSTI
jgi:SAM-dependent methyltransferase